MEKAARGEIIIARNMSSNTKALVLANSLLVNVLGGSFATSHPIRVDVKGEDIYAIIPTNARSEDVILLMNEMREYPDNKD